MAVFDRASHAIRSATALSAARPAYAAGIRASIATVIPLAAGHLLGDPAAGTWMSLGGFLGALSDRGGSYALRARTMAILMATGALAAALGALVAGHLAVALIATFAIAFVTSVFRVWGNSGVSVGTATLTVYVVSLAIPSSQPKEFLVRAGFLVVGTLWSMLVALVLWPLRPFRPARVAVAACYRTLASYIEEVAGSLRARQTAEWPVQYTPTTIASVRTALENARTVLVQLRRGRPGSMDRGERLLVLSESADQLFGHIVALGEILSGIPGDTVRPVLHDTCVDILHTAAVTSREIARAIEAESDAEPVAVPWSGERLRAVMRAHDGESALEPYEYAAVVLDRAAQFASAASVSVQALNSGHAEHDASKLPVRSSVGEDIEEEQSLRDRVIAMMSPGSLLLRFGLRVAVVTTLAVALAELFELKRGYWVTITIIVILQPYSGVTLTRALQRVIGTVLGALVAAGLGAYFHDPRAVLIIAAVFVACCVALLPLNYAAFSVFLTPTFVLLAEASAGEWHLAGTRVEMTLLGGALALLGTRLLWPSAESSRFPVLGAAALRANAAYLDTVVEHFDDRGEAAGELMRAARRTAGLANVNAEESLQRALGEAHGDETRIAPALTVLAYVRRFTATVAALGVARHAADASAKQTLEAFRHLVDGVLLDLADALERGRPPLPLPVLRRAVSDAALSPVINARLERLSRQTRTLHDAVARMLPAQSRYGES